MSIDTLHALQEPDLTPPSGTPRPSDVDSRIAPDLDRKIASIFSAQTAQTAQVLARMANREAGYDIRNNPTHTEPDQALAHGAERPAEPSVQDRTDIVIGNMSDRSAHIRGRKVIAHVNGKPLTRKEADSIRYPRSHDSDDRGRIKQATGNFLVKLAGVAFVGKKRSSLKPVSDVRSRPTQNR